MSQFFFYQTRVSVIKLISIFVLQVAQMMVVVASAFIVSWTPFYVITFISQVQPKSFLKDSNFLFTMLLIHWFGFLHSCINPIIYNFMNEKFHRNFKQILHRCWIKRHSFRKNSTLLFGSSSRSSKSKGLENSPCTEGRQRQQQCQLGSERHRIREKGLPDILNHRGHQKLMGHAFIVYGKSSSSSSKGRKKQAFI